jgi:hypothetical protein
MRVALVFALILIVAGTSAPQQISSNAPQKKVDADPPSLPVIDEGACPFEGCTFGKWTVTKETPLYSSWKEDRTVIGKLTGGETVVGLTGVHITKKPDKIQVLVDMPKLGLRRGEIIFRYMFRGEGFADLWAHGEWMQEADCSFITEADGDGCARDCSAKVVENGAKEWWVKVRTNSGQVGWAKAEDNFDGMDALA